MQAFMRLFLLVMLSWLWLVFARDPAAWQLMDVYTVDNMQPTQRLQWVEQQLGPYKGLINSTAKKHRIPPRLLGKLVARVKAVLKRSPKHELHSAEKMSFNRGMLTIDAQSYEVKKNGLSLKVTPTEFKILSVLSNSPGRVFTRGELVESALGYQFEGYERSIDAHIKNIRQKIEDDPKSPNLIHTVYGVGYKFAGMRDDKKSLG